MSTFHEKLRKCVLEQGLNKARAAREVGLPESTISSYLSKDDSLPRADIAIKIARALKVPFEWLFDDSKSWPPPKEGKPSLESATDEELMAEIDKRYIRLAKEAAARLAQIRKVQWSRVTPRLLAVPMFDKIPRELAEAFDLAWAPFREGVRFSQFNPAPRYEQSCPEEDIQREPGSSAALTPDRATDKMFELLNADPFYRLAADYVMRREGARLHNLPDAGEAERSRLLARLAEQTANAEAPAPESPTPKTYTNVAPGQAAYASSLQVPDTASKLPTSTVAAKPTKPRLGKPKA